MDTVDADTVKDGDIVDIPVWMDVWYGPADLKMPPWTILSFDRLVLLREEAAKVRGSNVEQVIELNRNPCRRERVRWVARSRSIRIPPCR